MGSRRDTYRNFPSLERPENNIPLLLTWVSPRSKQGRQFNILEEWARSQDGRNLYVRLVEEFQSHQTVEQLTLTMVALMSYRRFYPDSSDGSDQPITGSYITDLDALLRGRSLGNSGTVAERMVFALSRTLNSLGEDFEDLLTFVETALNQEHPPLHALDGLADEYVCLKIFDGLLHNSVILKLAAPRLSELRGKDDNRVDVTQLEELLIQKTHIHDPSEHGHFLSQIIGYASSCILTFAEIP